MKPKIIKIISAAFLGSTVFLIGAFFLRDDFSQKLLRSKALGADSKQELFIYKNKYYERGGLLSFTSKEDPIIGLGAYNIYGEATVDVYRVSASDVLNGLLYDDKGKQINTPFELSKFEKVTSFTKYVDSGYNKDSENKMSLPLEDHGIWLVNVSLGGVQSKAFIVRSNIGSLVREGDGKLIFWTQDLSSKRSLSGASVKIYNLQKEAKNIFEAVSNDEGIIETDLSNKGDVAFVKKGDDMALVPLNLENLYDASSFRKFVEKTVGQNIFTFTDRPLYAPGDKVYFKSIIREDDDARYSIKKGTAEVEVWKGWGGEKEVISKHNYEISDEGTISGEFQLSEDLKNGQYYLGIRRDSSDIPKNSPYAGYYSEYVSQISFSVEYYQKPEYGVDIAVRDNDIISGDDLEFLVHGKYFSGQPISGQEISYEVYSSDFYEYAYAEGSSGYDLDNDFRYGYRYGKSVVDGKATLDTQGQVKIKIDSTIPDGSKRKSQIYSIEVELKDSSGNESFDRKNVLVRAGEFSIYRNQDNYTYGAKIGQEIAIPVILNPASANRALTGQVMRTWWEKYPDNQKSYENKYSYIMKEEALPQISAVTDSHGKATLRFTPQNEGSYNMTLYGFDDRGNRVTKEFFFWVSDKNGYYSGGGKDKQGLTIKAGQEEYAPQNEARFTIYSEIPDRDVFFAMERGYVDRYRVVRIKGNESVVSVPLKDNDMPNTFAYIGSFSDSKIEESNEKIMVSAQSKKMKIVLTPDKAKYEPGEKATVSIKTTDYRERPVSAEVAVWLVDKALFELKDSSTGDVFKSFWRERYDGTRGSNSLVGIYGNLAEKGGGGEGGRTVFKDTAYWNPKVKTDKNGYAQVTFDLPDNLTTWVISGIGTNRDTMVGQITNEISVSKDVIIRPVLPEILRVSDKATISALAQNFTDQTRTFSAKLEFDAGDVENVEQEIRLEPNGSQLVYWKVNPDKEDENAKIIFSLLGDSKENSDAVEKNISVMKTGYWDVQAKVLDEGLEHVINLSSYADPEKTTLKLFLSSTMLGTLPSSLEYLLDYPYGCVEQTTSRFVPVVIAKENPILLRDSIREKNLDDFIKTGVDRLAQLQSSDGGWGWWGDTSDYFISAYVTEYLLRAQKVGADVDKEMIEKAKQFFQRDIQDMNLDPEKLRETNILRAYGKSLFGERMLVEDFEGGLSPDILAMAVISNVRNGLTDPGKNGRDKLISMAKEEGEGIYWPSGKMSHFGSVDASTGLALRAFIESGGDRQTIEKAVRFLTKRRKFNYWSNTFGTVQVVNALVSFAKIEKEIFPFFQYDVKLDGEEIAHGSFDNKNWEDEILIDARKIKNNSAVLKIEKTGENHIYSETFLKEFRLSDDSSGRKDSLKITRSYVNEKGSNYSIGVGDIVDVILNVTGNMSDQGFNYLAIEDQLPAGMVPVNPSFKNNPQYEHSDISFGGYLKEIKKSGVVFASGYPVRGQTPGSYRYKARVVSEGEYKAPPATAFLMYSPEVNGRSDAKDIQIARESEKLFDSTGTLRSKAGKIAKINKTWQWAKSHPVYSICIATSSVMLVVALGWIGRTNIREKIIKIYEKLKNKDGFD